MKSIRFTLITVVSIVILLGIGYFAITGLTSPHEYLEKNAQDKQTIGDLRKIESEPETESRVPSVLPDPITTTQTISEPEAPSQTADPKKALAQNIQKLLDAKTVLKVGSKGPSVGYIQEFMNMYFNKNLKVDNDFGKTLETNVKSFQKAVGLPQTGQVGTQGLTKMVQWLNK